MPEFTYTARTADGNPRVGTLFSTAAGEVVSDLRGRGWIVLDVTAATDPGDSPDGSGLTLNPAALLPATRFDVELGMQQLATMIRSGLSLLTSLKTAAEQVRRPAMRHVWTRIYHQIEEGSSFADAIEADRRYFPQMVVQLIRVGESSGTLETVLSQGADHLERTRALRTTLLTALMYPALVLVAAIAVTAFMVVSVIPKLQAFIAHSGKALPPMTQALMDSTDWLNTHVILILTTLLVVTVTSAVAWRIKSSRLWIDRTLLRVPLIGGVLRLAGTALMARGMALLLENGITLLDAIQITRSLVANRAMRLRLDLTREAVIEGRPLAESLMAGREFLPMLGRMAAVGETTGTLDTVLAEVARFHESQLANTVKRLSLLIEPAVILVVGGIVGFVYTAFFLALYSLAGGR